MPQEVVSIHTPTKGVTEMGSVHVICREFQSTHPRRVWLDLLTFSCDFCKVSIHTPTKGVTLCSVKCLLVRLFQSTHPRRVWLGTHIIYALQQRFQSTHPRRVWLERGESVTRMFKFQSTHPRRVWQYCDYQKDHQVMFQSTHPRRVWLSEVNLSLVCLSFNPHTHEGCDMYFQDCDANERVSIHTPTKGVTW